MSAKLKLISNFGAYLLKYFFFHSLIMQLKKLKKYKNFSSNNNIEKYLSTKKIKFYKIIYLDVWK